MGLLRVIIVDLWESSLHIEVLTWNEGLTHAHLWVNLLRLLRKKGLYHSWRFWHLRRSRHIERCNLRAWMIKRHTAYWYIKNLNVIWILLAIYKALVVLLRLEIRHHSLRQCLLELVKLLTSRIERAGEHRESPGVYFSRFLLRFEILSVCIESILV